MFAFIFIALVYGIADPQEGIVITKKDSIVGEVRVDFDQNQVVIKTGAVYEVFHASQVKQVNIYDNNQPVKYFSTAYGAEQKNQLFRVISEGKLSLVYRPGIRINEETEAEYSDYHVYADGEIILSLSTNKELLKLMKDKKEEVKSYLSSHVFYIDDAVHLQELFDYYNSL